MTMDFNDVKTTPTLTLDPFKEEAPKAPDTPVMENPLAELPAEKILSAEELSTVDQFAKQIDLTDSTMILQYGAGTQQKMADFSESALENVKTKDLGEVGNLIGDVVNQLKSFDVEEEEKGFLGFFKKQGNKLQSLKTKYAKAEANVGNICDVLENHQITLMKDIALLDKMYELNHTYYKELSMYILAGKQKLEEVRTGELKQLTDKATMSGLPEDVQAAKDLGNMCDRFEKKIHDLELTRVISIQTAPQIRMIQDNDTAMTEKIQSTLVNTIPLWKSQMVLALGVEHSNQAARAQREVTDLTNELLQKNADTLKMASVETAKESQRGVVDMETLNHTNETLISTLDEVMQIQAEGKVKRQEAEVEMAKLEQDLKNKMLEIAVQGSK